MRSLPLVMCLLVVLSASALAEDNTASPPTVNVRIPAGTVEDALARIFVGSGVVYALGPGVARLETSEIALADVPFECAVKIVCRSLKLVCEAQDGAYRIWLPAALPKITDTSVESGMQPGDVGAKPAMSRYEVRQLLGRPDQILLSPVAGSETWVYGTRLVVFRNARVSSIEEAPPLRISLGLLEKPQFGESYLWTLPPPPKYDFGLAACLGYDSTTSHSSGNVWVKPYYRRDGTPVKGYWRTK